MSNNTKITQDQFGNKLILQHDRHGRLVSKTEHRPDGTIWFKITFDPNTTKPIQHTEYLPNGKTIHNTVNYSPITGKAIKQTFFHPNGKTALMSWLYDQNTEAPIKKIIYHPKGTIKTEITYSQFKKEINNAIQTKKKN